MNPTDALFTEFSLNHKLWLIAAKSQITILISLVTVRTFHTKISNNVNSNGATLYMTIVSTTASSFCCNVVNRTCTSKIVQIYRIYFKKSHVNVHILYFYRYMKLVNKSWTETYATARHFITQCRRYPVSKYVRTYNRSYTNEQNRKRGDYLYKWLDINYRLCIFNSYLQCIKCLVTTIIIIICEFNKLSFNNVTSLYGYITPPPSAVKLFARSI